jgi:hypothetical protein
MLRAHGREQDDVAHSGGSDRRSDVLRTAIVIHAKLARVLRWREKDVRSISVIQCTLEGRPILDVGDSYVGSFVLPRLTTGGCLHNDADSLPLCEKTTRDDPACISGSTQHDKHEVSLLNALRATVPKGGSPNHAERREARGAADTHYTFAR